MTDKEQLQVDCPSCKTKSVWSKDNPFRPFCSQRCRDIDFCGWANEEQKISGQSDYDDLLSEDLFAEKEKLNRGL